MKVSKSCLHHLNSRWLQRASIQDASWMTRGKLVLENIYVLHNVNAAAKCPLPSEFPWFVILLLGTRSRKHIFAHRFPNVKTYQSGIEDFCHKLRWRYHHRNSDTVASKLLLKLRKSTKPFNLALDMAVEVNWACKHVSSQLMQHYNSAKRVWKARQLMGSGIPMYVFAALKWLERESWRVAVSDKDGVFVLIPSTVYDELLVSQLQKNWYEHVPLSHMPKRSVVCGAKPLIAKLSSFVKKEITNDIYSSLYLARNTHMCKLSCTIKTHKEAGEVVARPLQASMNHVLSGLSAWVDMVLSSVLARKVFICKSSLQVIIVLDRVPVPADACIGKLDIKDFFLNGEQDFLAESCFRIVKSELESGHIFPGIEEDQVFSPVLFREALKYVLYPQYVDYGSDHSMARVALGSGMGSKHSPAVSSCTFLSLVERHVCTNANPGLLIYLRYHDDMLLVTSSRQIFEEVCGRVCELASPCYVIKVEEISEQSVCMLDMQIFKGRRFENSGKLDFCPYVKPTARHIPLGGESSHSAGIHMSWPVAEIKRMWALSYNKSDYEKFKAVKVNRFEDFFLAPEVLEKCRSWQPISRHSSIARELLESRPNSKCLVVRLVLPFNPHLYKGMSRVMSGIASTYELLVANVMQPSALVVSWKNDSNALAIVLRQRRI